MILDRVSPRGLVCGILVELVRHKNLKLCHHDSVPPCYFLFKMNGEDIVAQTHFILLVTCDGNWASIPFILPLLRGKRTEVKTSLLSGERNQQEEQGYPGSRTKRHQTKQTCRKENFKSTTMLHINLPLQKQTSPGAVFPGKVE